MKHNYRVLHIYHALYHFRNNDNELMTATFQFKSPHQPGYSGIQLEIDEEVRRVLEVDVIELIGFAYAGRRRLLPGHNL